MKKLARVIPFTLDLTPFLALAATGDIGGVIAKIREIVDAVIPLFMVLAFAIFLWGIVKYITAGGSPEKEKAARGFIIYGLIGIFLLVAFWGIIKIFTTTFGLDTPGKIPIDLPY